MGLWTPGSGFESLHPSHFLLETRNPFMSTCRTGIGWDQHAFAETPPLVLCGVKIPEAPRLHGHSDGDAALHAVADALLGAAARGDLGGLFPPEDPRWRDQDSRFFVTRALAELGEAGWELVNLDVVMIVQRPRLSPYLPAMRRVLAEICGLTEEQLSLKAKSPEGLGALGRGEGIQVWAVAHVRRREGGSGETPGKDAHP